MFIIFVWRSVGRLLPQTYANFKSESVWNCAPSPKLPLSLINLLFFPSQLVLGDRRRNYEDTFEFLDHFLFCDDSFLASFCYQQRKFDKCQKQYCCWWKHQTIFKFIRLFDSSNCDVFRGGRWYVSNLWVNLTN